MKLRHRKRLLAVRWKVARRVMDLEKVLKPRPEAEIRREIEMKAKKRPRRS